MADSDIKRRVISSISYFDIFQHPLKKQEILNLCLNGDSLSDFERVLGELVNDQTCNRLNDFYGLGDQLESKIATRLKKEKNADKYFRKLPFYAKIIRSFPFVRGIAISGSLSKNVMYEDGDIDYFIITAPGRLWISRSLLILFKKIVLLNSRKYFCINYMVDENNLEILDKNIFTAVELCYLAPVYNEKLFDRLKKNNSWTKSYFPDFKHPINVKPVSGGAFVKRILEAPFSGKLGDRIDLFFMKLSFRRWKRKFGHFDEDKFELTMRTNRGISKHHPLDFQNKVLEEFRIRMEKLGQNV